MKKLILSVIALSAFTITANAQSICKVVSPASIAGNKTFAWAEWAQTPDFNTPGVFVQDTIQWVEDGTAGNNAQGNPLSQEGCSATGLINPAAIQGKIAMIYRGSCEFGIKAFNAQNAGAVGVIIINREEAVLAMGPGADGDNVTIPVVMVQLSAGQAMKAEHANGAVVVFLGNKVGVNANDLSTNGGVARIKPFAGSSNLYQTNNFTPAIEIYNLGSADQPSVSVQAKIVGPGAVTVYDETVGPFSMNANDTIFIQTGLPQAFPEFTMAVYPVGDYVLTYTLTLGSNTDDDPSDNVITSPFRINPNIVSLSRLDANDRPIATTYPSNSVGIYDACMTFRSATGTPAQTGVVGYYFYPEADTAAIDITGSEILFKVFSWADSSELDGNLTELTSDSYYIGSKDETRQMQYKSLDTPFEFIKDQLYLVCLETADGVNIAFGYDGVVDYSGNSVITGIAASPVRVNNAGTETWYEGGWNGTSALSLGLEMANVSGIAENNKVASSVFPNPANDVVTIRTTGAGNANVAIADISGKIVATNAVTFVNGAATVNTNKLEAGMYIFNIIFADGTSSTVNVIKK